MEIQLQDLILRRVKKELGKMPDKSHNISFAIRLLVDNLKEYLEHQSTYTPTKQMQDVRQYLILEFQALCAILTTIIESYPDVDTEYYGKLGTMENELAKWAQNRGFRRQEWK